MLFLFFTFSNLFSLIYGYVSLKLTLNNYNSINNLITNICFGDNQTQCFDFSLSLDYSFIWMINQTNAQPSYITPYNTSISQKFSLAKKQGKEEENITDEIDFLAFNKNISGFGAADTLVLGNGNNINISDFYFILSNNSNWPFTNYNNFEGFLGIGNPYNKTLIRYSILEQLYEKKIISYRLLGIQFSSNHKEHLFFGHVPQVIFKDYVHYGQCNLSTSNDSKWRCIVNRVRLSRKYLSLYAKTPIVFTLKSGATTFPYKYISIFKEEYKSNKKCWFEEVNENTTNLFCSIQASIPSIYIEFDNWQITLPEKVLNSKSFFYYYTIAIFSKNHNEIVLSMDILKYFVLIFDKENEQIGFYNDEFVNYIGRGFIKRPTFERRFDPSFGLVEEKTLGFKAKIQRTLYIFGVSSLFMVLILMGICGCRKTEKINYNKYFLDDESEKEMHDIDIRDVFHEQLEKDFFEK